jgi:hypothetical protein
MASAVILCVFGKNMQVNFWGLNKSRFLWYNSSKGFSCGKAKTAIRGLWALTALFENIVSSPGFAPQNNGGFAAFRILAVRRAWYNR